MNTEIWKDIPEYEGFYQISNLGRVKSLVGWNGHEYAKREKILKQSLSTTGYYKVDLKRNGQRKSQKVHRIVAEAFIPKVDGKPYINHKDGNPINNSVDNLEWCTQKENVNHALKTGLKKCFRISEYELRSLYESGMNMKQIAELKDTSISVIQNNMKKYGIDRRTSGESKDKYHIDLDVLIQELKSGATNKELSEKYNCHSNIIAVRRYQMKKKGVI